MEASTVPQIWDREPQGTIGLMRPEKNKYRAILNGWLDISVNLGDITNENVDAITNAANE